MVKSDDSLPNSPRHDPGIASASHGFTTLPNSTGSRSICLSSDSYTLARRICDCEDREAWTELYDRYSPYVRGYLRRWRMPHHLVEDVYHDSMTSFYEAVQSGSFRLAYSDETAGEGAGQSGRHPIRPYLTTTVRNRAIAVLDREKKAPRNPGYSDWDVPELSDRELQEYEEQEWRRAILHQCVLLVRQEFDDRANYVFHLRMAEGRSSREVAELVETSETAVNMIVHRVKKRIATVYPEVESVF